MSRFNVFENFVNSLVPESDERTPLYFRGEKIEKLVVVSEIHYREDMEEIIRSLLDLAKELGLEDEEEEE